MKPQIGHWYRIGEDPSFEVLSFDEDDGTIEIQYFDGTCEEIDIEEWDEDVEDNFLFKIDPPDFVRADDIDAAEREDLISDEENEE